MTAIEPVSGLSRPGTLRIIAEIQRAQEDDTYATVAARLGISRQRIGQVVLRAEKAGVDLGSWARARARPERRGG